MAPSLFYIYAMATSFFYIYAMATSFFYIYAMATSFFYIYVMATSFFYFYVMDISSFYIYVMATSFFYIYKSTERPVVLLNAIFSLTFTNLDYTFWPACIQNHCSQGDIWQNLGIGVDLIQRVQHRFQPLNIYSS